MLTAYENVEDLLLLIQKVPRRRVLALLEAVGIARQRDKYPISYPSPPEVRASRTMSLLSGRSFQQPTVNAEQGID